MPPAPKPAHLRQRRNRYANSTTIEAAPAQKPALDSVDLGVDLLGENLAWHPEARRAWDTWWSSPIASEWVDADVPGLIETIRLVNDFWTEPKADTRRSLRAEVRMSLREYGLSSLGRLQLRWELKRLDEAPSAPRKPERRAHATKDPRLTLVG